MHCRSHFLTDLRKNVTDSLPLNLSLSRLFAHTFNVFLSMSMQATPVVPHKSWRKL